MTLRRTLAILVCVQTLVVGALCLVGLRGLAGLRGALEQTAHEFTAIESAHRAGHHLSVARLLARERPARLDAARRRIVQAAEAIRDRGGGAPVRSSPSEDRFEDLRRLLSGGASAPDADALASLATSGLAGVQRVSEGIRDEVRTRRAVAVEKSVETATQLAIAGGAIVLLTGMGGIGQHRAVVRPLASLRSGMDRLRRTDFSQRVPARGFAEHRAIADRFNAMADDLRRAHQTLERRVAERTAQVIRSERLARLGVIAGGFAHEINNPLSIVRAHAELALRRSGAAATPGERERADEEMEEALRIALEEVDRASRILERLSSLGARETAPHREVLLEEAVRTGVRLVEPIAARSGSAVEHVSTCAPERTRILGDEAELVQVVVNLLLNAIEATAGGGRVRIEVRAEESDVIVCVADDGVGMTEEEVASAFDPFVSGTQGMGLGLSVCQAIAERHGATFDAASPGPGQGSVLTLRLPARLAEGVA